MTPCEKLGYKVGMQFELTDNCSVSPKGSIVILSHDDGTESPWFKSEDHMPWPVNLEIVKRVFESPVAHVAFIDNQIAQLEQQLNDLNQQRREIINRNNLNK